MRTLTWGCTSSDDEQQKNDPVKLLFIHEGMIVQNDDEDIRRFGVEGTESTYVKSMNSAMMGGSL